VSDVCGALYLWWLLENAQEVELAVVDDEFDDHQFGKHRCLLCLCVCVWQSTLVLLSVYV